MIQVNISLVNHSLIIIYSRNTSTSDDRSNLTATNVYTVTSFTATQRVNWKEQKKVLFYSINGSWFWFLKLVLMPFKIKAKVS